VWLALDERTGLDVALKIIPREGKAAARAEREALAARRLRHDRCVRAYDVGHDSSHVYIAYEYVAGRTLREAIRAGAVSDRDAVEIAAQVLDALAHAHRAGIVHRDVKPANVLVEDRDELAVRLLDFGLAQFDGADTLTAVGDVPGTLAYISPERLSGEEASSASDVWSVGVVLWEILASRHPFWGMPLQEVAQAISAGAPPLAEERARLPRRLTTAVDRALSPDPSARPRASDLATEIRNAVRQGQARPAKAKKEAAREDLAPGLLHARRLVPVGLAAAGALFGATLLPFWPALVVAALVLGAAVAAWFNPRLALAVVLAAPIFPFGNVADSAALVYGAFAVAWLVLMWRDARFGLLFLCGPLLAGLGLLTLCPLVVQPARGILRRSLQGAAAIVAAALAAATAAQPLPLVGTTAGGRVAPLDSVADVASTTLAVLMANPPLLAAVVLSAAASAALQPLRARWRFGAGAVGLALVGAGAVAGAGIAGTLVALVVWGVAAVVFTASFDRRTASGAV